VLDVSQTAIEVTKKRLGSAAEQVRWLVGDIVEIELEPHAYDLWHDRAVFHFLTTPERRITYVQQVTRAVKPGGHVIVSTFGPDGPAEMQWAQGDALWRRIAARRVWWALPLGGEFQGTARNTIWNHPAISLLLLPARMKWRCGDLRIL
jgi:SAM-dependent methyltransferase